MLETSLNASDQLMGNMNFLCVFYFWNSLFFKILSNTWFVFRKMDNNYLKELDLYILTLGHGFSFCFLFICELYYPPIILKY